MNPQIHNLLIQVAQSSLDDPLIDWQSETILKVLVFVFIFGVAMGINLISSKIEHAIVFAFVCTGIALAFFMIK